MDKYKWILIILILLLVGGCMDNKKSESGKLIIKVYWPEQSVKTLKRTMPIDTDQIDVELYKGDNIISKKSIVRSANSIGNSIEFTELKMGTYFLKGTAFVKTKIVAKGETDVEITPGENSAWLDLKLTNSAPSKPIVISPVERYVYKKSEAKINWNPCSDPDGDNVTYNIYKGTKIDSLDKIVINTSLKEYTFVGLDDMTRYYYQIEADDLKGGVTKSEVMSFEVEKNYPVSILESPYTSKTAITIVSTKTNQTKISLNTTVAAINVWEDFTANKSFILPGENGAKSVFVKYKNDAGTESGVYEISTILDTVKPIGTVRIKQSTTESVIVTANALDENNVDKMAFSFDNISWGSWMNYTTEATINVADNMKKSKVYAKYKDTAGNESEVVSDELAKTAVSVVGVFPEKDKKLFEPGYIEITFSSDMNQSTLTKDNIIVSQGTSSAIIVDGVFTYSNKKLKFVPNLPFAGGSNYSITIKSNVQDTIGNNMTSDYKWSFEVIVYNYYGSPTVDSNNNVYMGSVFGKLLSFDSAGMFRWGYKTGGGIYATPVIYNNNIFVPSKDKNIYSFKLNNTTTNASFNWVYNTGNTVYASPTVNSQGVLYQMTFDGRLLAIDAKSSSVSLLKWEYELNTQPFYTGIALTTANTIYVSAGNTLYSIDENNTTKREKWTTPFQMGSENYYSKPIVDEENIVYIGSKDKKLYAVKSDGTKKWEYLTGGEVNSSPTISGSTIYIGSNDQKLYALNRKPLDISSAVSIKKWEYKTNGAIYSKPLLTSDGAIIVGTTGKSLYCIDASGTLMWKVDLDDEIYSTPCSINGDIIYVTTTREDIYAVKNNKNSGTILWKINMADYGN